MRYRVKIERVICLWGLGVLLSAAGPCALAAVPGPAGDMTGEAVEPATADTLPSYKGEGSIYLGFRWVQLDQLSRPSEYEEEDSSPVLGISGIACPLPHRYHLHGEYLGESSYYWDAGYAYRDIVLFRDLLVGVRHNLDHYNYLYPGDPPSIQYADRNPGDQNDIDFMKNDLSLRLKAPDFPMHAFMKHRTVERDGSIEERFMLGDYSNLTKVSQSRDIDWDAKDLILGMNSHLGPIEVEYAYNQAEFDPGNNSVLYDSYPPSFIFGRPGGVYPHNVVPETDTTGNSVKFHTSFTGQVVASATLSNTENDNIYSGTESEAWKAAFDLRWLPDPLIGLFFRYRHRTTDQKNPDTVTIFGGNRSMTYQVRDLVSSHNDLASLSARYRPWSGMTVIGNYEFEHRHRTDLEGWATLPENSEVNRVGLTAHVSPMDTLKLKGIYEYENFQNPSYNTEPDDLNRFCLNATYTPLDWLIAYMDYNLTLTQRDDLRFVGSDVAGGERDGRTDRFLGSLSFVLSQEATLTTSWSYSRWDVDQDMAYLQWEASGSGVSSVYYDREVPYTDESNTLSLSLFWQLRKDLSLTGDLSYTFAEGEYVPGDHIKTALSPAASASTVETNETILTVELAKRVLADWEVGLRFHADFFNDKFSDATSEHQDGDLFITTFTLKRYF